MCWFGENTLILSPWNYRTYHRHDMATEQPINIKLDGGRWLLCIYRVLNTPSNQYNNTLPPFLNHLDCEPSCPFRQQRGNKQNRKRTRLNRLIGTQSIFVVWEFWSSFEFAITHWCINSFDGTLSERHNVITCNPSKWKVIVK